MRNKQIALMRRVVPLLAALAGGTSVGMAGAQPAARPAATAPSKTTAATDYNIPAQPLAQALRQFAEVTGLQLLYGAQLAEGKQSSDVAGQMTANAALTKLLAGSGLAFTFLTNGSVVLAQGTPEGVRLLGILKVDGVNSLNGKATVANGINGSRDVQATEGTGSYTTNATSMASKSVESLKDTPYAVSVITRQRLDDQAITNFISAMDQMTGITTQYASSGTNQKRDIYSRGFLVDSYSIDGGSPLLSATYNITPLIDFSAYDSVQLERGAAGLFNGYGGPGGIVNLVRKKPLDHNQIQIEASVGSWQTYRTSLDVSGPLAFDGKLRGRAVVTGQSNHYFYDVAKSKSSLLYANLEADLTASTRLNVGINQSRDNSVPFAYGLPRYSNGDDLGLPTSTCLCFPWSRINTKTAEGFAELNQKFGPDWSLAAHVTKQKTRGDSKFGEVFGAINPVTKKGGGGNYEGFSPFVANQTSTDVTVNGKFELLGRRHDIAVGANVQKLDASGTQAVGQEQFSGVNTLTFDPNSFPEPVSLPPSGIYGPWTQDQSGAYVNLALNPLENLHVKTGVRYTEYKASLSVLTVCNTISFFCPTLGVTSTIFALFGLSPLLQVNSSAHNVSKPNVSVSYDLSKDLSVFGTYATIYQPQGNIVTVSGKSLPPITGSNTEFGVKWLSPEKDLNASLTSYSIVQSGNSVLDPSVSSSVSKGLSKGGVNCCYLDQASPNKLESKGIDAELTGQLKKNWQLSLGYTFNLNRRVNPGSSGSDGVPTVSESPKHLMKLFTSYRFDKGDDWLKRLTVGGGINWQSSAYSQGTYCQQFDTTTGDCLAGQQTPFQYTVGSYALVAGFLDYRFGDTWRLSLNGSNLTNKRTYQTISGALASGNWYVQPASYTLTLRGKW